MDGALAHRLADLVLEGQRTAWIDRDQYVGSHDAIERGRPPYGKGFGSRLLIGAAFTTARACSARARSTTTVSTLYPQVFTVINTGPNPHDRLAMKLLI